MVIINHSVDLIFASGYCRKKIGFTDHSLSHEEMFHLPEHSSHLRLLWNITITGFLRKYVLVKYVFFKDTKDNWL